MVIAPTAASDNTGVGHCGSLEDMYTGLKSITKSFCKLLCSGTHYILLCITFQAHCIVMSVLRYYIHIYVMYANFAISGCRQCAHVQIPDGMDRPFGLPGVKLTSPNRCSPCVPKGPPNTVP